MNYNDNIYAFNIFYFENLSIKRSAIFVLNTFCYNFKY